MTLRLRSGICDLLKQYHDIKIASGTKAVSIDRYINYIDDFYFNNNFKEMVYTKEMNSLWLKKRNDLEGNYVRYTRNNYLIDFLSFVTSLGYGVYIPRRLPYKSVNFIAYIFSEKELEKYFEYIDSFFSYKPTIPFSFASRHTLELKCAMSFAFIFIFYLLPFS